MRSICAGQLPRGSGSWVSVNRRPRAINALIKLVNVELLEYKSACEFGRQSPRLKTPRKRYLQKEFTQDVQMWEYWAQHSSN